MSGRTTSVFATIAVLISANAFAEKGPVESAEPATASPGESESLGEPVAQSLPTEPGVPADHVSGIRVPAEPDPQPGLWPARVGLFVPRLAYSAVMAPPLAAAWTLDRFAVVTRFKRIFFNHDGTLGLYPFLDIESGFGTTVGVAFVNYDLFKRAMGTKWSARTGGRSGPTYQAELAPNGWAGGWFHGRLLGRYSQRTRDQFFGIGNQDEVESRQLEPMASPLDPFGDRAVRTDYRHRDLVAALSLRARLGGRFRLELEARYLDREYRAGTGASSAIPVQDVYDTDELVGFSRGLSNLFTSLQLTFDSRTSEARYTNPRVYSTGWLMSAGVGRADGFGDDDTRYWRYLADVRRFFNLYRGDRVLVLRARAVSVHGEARGIPFDNLPFLGGRTFLRGYPSQRFRDRVALLSSAEYQYPINHYLAGYLFVDGGRVYRDYSAVDAEDVRIGFGGGLDYRNATSTIVRMAVSSSVDGAIYFNLGFEAVADVNTR